MYKMIGKSYYEIFLYIDIKRKIQWYMFLYENLELVLTDEWIELINYETGAIDNWDYIYLLKKRC